MLTLCLYVYYTEKPVIEKISACSFWFCIKLWWVNPWLLLCRLLWFCLITGRSTVLSRKRQSKFNVMASWRGKYLFFILSAIIIYPPLFLIQTNRGHYVQAISLEFQAGPTRQLLLWLIWRKHFCLMIWLSSILSRASSSMAGHRNSNAYSWLSPLLFIAMAKTSALSLVGWMCSRITIVPVIGIIQISLMAPYSMRDRYHYLPSIGICHNTGPGEFQLYFKTEELRKKIFIPDCNSRPCRAAILTWRQCGFWKNTGTLFTTLCRWLETTIWPIALLLLFWLMEGKIKEAIDHCK